MSVAIFSSRVGLFLFCCLFPLMFLYHLLAGARLIPMFLGGWWGPMTGVAGGVMAALLLWDIVSHKQWKGHAPFVLICTIVVAYAGYYRLRGESWQAGNAPLVMSLALVVAWVGLYGIGYFWALRRTGSAVVMGAWAGMVLVTIVFMDPASFSFIAVDKFGNQEIADYQWWALCVAVLAMAALAYARLWWQAVIMAATLVALYLLSSRSELFAWLAIAVLWSGQHLLKGRYAIVGLMIALTVAGGGLVYGVAWVSTVGVPPQLQEVLTGTTMSKKMAPPTNFRQTEILEGAASQSVTRRIELLENGVADIRSSPFFGVYAGQMQNGGSYGDYIHNGLEAWRQYGIVAFGLLLLLSVNSVFQSARRWWHTDDPQWRFAMYVSVFAAGLLLVSKSVGWPVPALAWGLVAGLRFGPALGR